MKDGIKLIGDVVLELRKKGEVIERQELKNLIVNAGKERVAKLINGVDSPTAFGYIAIGEGTTSPTTGDTALESEVTRASATKSYDSYKAIFEYTFSFGSGESYSITEAGVFDSATASGSTMLDRCTFSSKSVDSDTDLYVKVSITVA